MESSQEANAEVMREMTRKLYSQYEEKLQEAQRKHSAEKEVLLVRVCCLKHNMRDMASRFSQKLKGVMRLDIKRSQGVHSFIHSFIFMPLVLDACVHCAHWCPGSCVPLWR